MVDALEGEAKDENGDGHGRGGEGDDGEAGFGLDGAAMAALVEGTDGVVEVVAQEGAKEGTDDGGEVKEACGCWREEVNKGGLIEWEREMEEKTNRGCRE